MTHSPLPYPTSVRSSLHDIRSQISLLPAQRRVLEVVEGAGQPISSAEVAKTLKLHPNTAREHLDALLNAGLVTTLPMRTGKRGRPTLLYSVTTLDPNQILSTYLDVITATAISLAEGSDGVAQAFEPDRRYDERRPRKNFSLVTKSVQHLHGRRHGMGVDDVLLSLCIYHDFARYGKNGSVARRSVPHIGSLSDENAFYRYDPARASESHRRSFARIRRGRFVLRHSVDHRSAGSDIYGDDAHYRLRADRKR